MRLQLALKTCLLICSLLPDHISSDQPYCYHSLKTNDNGDITKIVIDNIRYFVLTFVFSNMSKSLDNQQLPIKNQ